MKVMNPLFSIATLLFSLLVLPASEAREQELQENRAKWEDMAWEDYAFNIQQRSNLPAPFSANLRVQVYQNQVGSVFCGDQDVTQDVTQVPGTVPTILELFDRLQLELNASYFDVTYDELYGSPANVIIDPDQEISDEELDIGVSNVVQCTCHMHEHNHHGLICRCSEG